MLARNVMPKDISLPRANPSSVNTLTTARNPETMLRNLNLIYDHMKQHFLTPKRLPFLFLRCDPVRGMASSFMRFLDHTRRRTTVRRTPLDEWSARRRDLYLTTHNTHKRQTSMPPAGFEPTFSVGERLPTHASDRSATGTGKRLPLLHQNHKSFG